MCDPSSFSRYAVRRTSVSIFEEEICWSSIQEPVTVFEARKALEGIGLGDVVIQFEREGMRDRLRGVPREHRPAYSPSSKKLFPIEASPRWHRKMWDRKLDELRKRLSWPWSGHDRHSSLCNLAV